VHGIVEHMQSFSTRPFAVIVGEPTSMKVVNAHKGNFSFRTRVTGFEGHSSRTDMGVNAVMYAAELIGFLGRLAEEMRGRAKAESRFDPPYTTVHVGTVKGGTALNIIPKECSFIWEYRLLPGEDEDEVIERFRAFSNDEILPRMKAVSDDAAIVTEARARVPALVPEEGSDAETLVMRLAGTNETLAVSYGTEAGIFQNAHIPAVICGPGNIEQAHKPDEFIDLSEVEACTAFLRRLIAFAAT
jgi:acetylornithine deacetylase